MTYFDGAVPKIAVNKAQHSVGTSCDFVDVFLP